MHSFPVIKSYILNIEINFLMNIPILGTLKLGINGPSVDKVPEGMIDLQNFEFLFYYSLQNNSRTDHP